MAPDIPQTQSERFSLAAKFPTSMVLVGLGAFVIRLWVALAYPSLAWPDEIYQTLEPAHRLAFGYGMIPWEFREGIRSWVPIAMLSAVMKLTQFIGPGSQGYLTGIRVFLAALGTIPALTAMAMARATRLRWPWLAGTTCALWFELVYLSTKALTEVFAASALCIALAYALTRKPETLKRPWILVGMVFSVVLGLRFHLGPAVAGAVLFLTWKQPRKFSSVLLGGFLGLAVFSVIDWMTLGTPSQSIWKNFYLNAMQGKAASFGTSSRWEYLASMAEVWSWGAIPFLSLAAVAWRRWPVLFITVVIIFFSHNAMSHKEYRFLAPALTVLVLSAGLGLCLIAERSTQFAAAAAVLLLAVSAWRAAVYHWEQLATRQHENTTRSMWTLNAGALKAFEALSVSRSLCGVGLVDLDWGWTGGLGYLHQNVPLYQLENASAFAANTRGFNVVVAPETSILPLENYKKGACYDGVCVFERPGPCDSGDYHTNRWLESNGM
jgi:GPI mannosyltransferase 3